MKYDEPVLKIELNADEVNLLRDILTDMSYAPVFDGESILVKGLLDRLED